MIVTYKNMEKSDNNRSNLQNFDAILLEKQYQCLKISFASSTKCCLTRYFPFRINKNSTLHESIRRNQHVPLPAGL